MAISVTILNSEQVVNSLKNKGIQIQEAIQPAIVESAMLLKEEIKESIIGNRSEPKSYKTGAFYDSIEESDLGNGAQVTSEGIPYSVFLEYGTAKFPARQHFQNSLTRMIPIITEKVQTVIDAALNS